MKETVGLTWTQIRKQRKFLKSAGMTFPREAVKRARGKQLVSDYVKVENKVF